MRKVTAGEAGRQSLRQVQAYQIRVEKLPWPHGEDQSAKTIILQFAGGGRYEYFPSEAQLDQSVSVRSPKYGDLETSIGYALSHGMIGEGVAALKKLKIPFKKLSPV